MVASWAFLGTSWDPFGGLLGPLKASWGRLGELLGPSLGILGGFLGDKAPKMPPRRPKEPPQGSKRLPESLQKTSRAPSRSLFEAQHPFKESVQRIIEKVKENNIGAN